MPVRHAVSIRFDAIIAADAAAILLTPAMPPLIFR